MADQDEREASAVVLPPRLDLSNAPDIAQQLLAYPSDSAIQVDASDVTHMGTLGVQVLMAAARRARHAGGSVTVSGLSDRVHGQLSALGLTPDNITEAAE
ncbi:MAG: STAS domain-containing protein [Pseudomonadota bacterium]